MSEPKGIGKDAMRVSHLPVRVLSGVSVILVLVSGKAGMWRHPYPDNSMVSWGARVKDSDSRHPSRVARHWLPM